jgi:hypothetical protein
MLQPVPFLTSQLMLPFVNKTDQSLKSEKTLDILMHLSNILTFRKLKC